MSKRRETDDDSDSCGSTSERDAGAKKKKTCSTAHPQTRDEAQDYLDGQVAAAALCQACLFRDRAHTAVDRYVDILALGGAAAAAADDVQFSWHQEVVTDPASVVAKCIIEDCYRLGCIKDFYRPAGDATFSTVVTECRTRQGQRRASLIAMPGRVAEAVDAALQHLPDAVVDIVVSYIDIVADFIDLPFVRGVYTVYFDAIQRFVIRQQTELLRVESFSSARRMLFDGQRRLAANAVFGVINGAGILANNHPHGAQFAAIAKSLHESMEGLSAADHCNHTILQAKSTRATMTRRADAVFAEEARLQQLGFDVAVQLF